MTRGSRKCNLQSRAAVFFLLSLFLPLTILALPYSERGAPLTDHFGRAFAALRRGNCRAVEQLDQSRARAPQSGGDAMPCHAFDEAPTRGTVVVRSAYFFVSTSLSTRLREKIYGKLDSDEQSHRLYIIGI